MPYLRYVLPASSSPTPVVTTPPSPTYYNPNAIWPTGSANTGTVFDGVGGPALIVVFVALGLLVGALAALIVVRRNPPTNAFLANLDAWYMGTGAGEEVVVGEEPELWEVKLVAPSAEREGKEAQLKEIRDWKDMKPLAAQFIPDEKVTFEEMQLNTLENQTSPTQNSHSPRRTHNPFTRAWSALRQYYFPPSPTQLSIPMSHSNSRVRSLQSPRTPYTGAGADEKEVGEVTSREPVPGQLRVAVAIAMPSREASVWYAGSKRREEERGAERRVPEFSIGLAHLRANMPPP